MLAQVTGRAGRVELASDLLAAVTSELIEIDHSFALPSSWQYGNVLGITHLLMSRGRATVCYHSIGNYY